MAALFSVTLVATDVLAQAADALDPNVKAYFDDALKDPFSARIEQTRGPRTGALQEFKGLLFGGTKPIDGTYVCYRVNAKNSYGAYAGWKQYVFSLTPSGRVKKVYEEDSGIPQRECSEAADPPIAGRN